jgi:hypothetical protein
VRRRRILVVIVLGAVLLPSACSPSSLGRSAGLSLLAENLPCPTGRTGVLTHFHPTDRDPEVVYDLDVPEGLSSSEEAHAGDLALPSGRLEVASGAEMGFPRGLTPVDLSVPGDRYPVTLLLARFDDGDQRVAFVELAVRPDPPVRWVESRALSFGTDGGDGGYISEEGADIAAGGNGQWLFDSLDYAKKQKAYPPCELVVFTDHPPLNTVIFATGWGDGRYPTVLGLDADGRISAVVTFTFVLPWRLAGLPGEPPQQVLDEEARREAPGGSTASP